MLFYFGHRISFNLPDRDEPRVGLATPRLSSTHRRWGSKVVVNDCVVKSSRFPSCDVTGLEKIRCCSTSTAAATCGVTQIATAMSAPTTDVLKPLSMRRLPDLGFRAALTSHTTPLFDSATRTNFQAIFQLPKTAGAPAHHATNSAWCTSHIQTSGFERPHLTQSYGRITNCSYPQTAQRTIISRTTFLKTE